MDDGNLHTSVVIELANQDDAEEPGSYKADLDELEASKDYVIDQIFCGENITVYALFEIPELRNKTSDSELVEIQNPAISDDFRFIHRNSFKKPVPIKPNSYRRKLPAKDYDEDVHFVPNKCTRNKSLYCLKHLGQNYEIPHREEGSADLEVLFSKDFVPKDPKQANFKAVSKGVNTDIAQSPKIIEEIQRAINVNFSYGKTEESKVEITRVLSSYKIVDAGLQRSFSSLSTDADSIRYRKKSSPNFLFVPLLMIEERLMSYFQKDSKGQGVPEERTMEAKSRQIATKVSFGTNTEVLDSQPAVPEEERRKESPLSEEIGPEGSESSDASRPKSLETEKSEVPETREGKEKKTAKPHLKKKDKNTILNEIKKLQGKLNSLIKSIESSELSLSTDEDENCSESEKKTSEEVLKRSEPVLTDSESFRRNQSRFLDDIPIFSPLPFTPPSKGSKSSSKKKPQNGDKGTDKETSEELEKSGSSEEGVSRREEGICEVKKPEVKLKTSLSCLNINWKVKRGRSVGPSKSDTSNRCNLPVPKHSCVKKSVSFDLRDDKIETCGLKKIKNSSFKVEGSLKANLRIMQNGEGRLGENLTSLTREMGDKAKIKLRVSKSELQNFGTDPRKEEVMFMQNGASTLNEEEGDAKMIYPNQNLISQKFVQNPEVHFCRADAIVSDALLKSVKMTSSSRGKLKTAMKTEETGKKTSGDTEKPTTPSKTLRKTPPVDSEQKKEVKPIRKSFPKSKTVERKFERKETFAHEVVKPKSVSGSRKFTVKGTAESKLHVDKLIKAEIEPKHEAANAPKSSLVKPNADEKSGNRTDRLPRPSSQKRELRENPVEPNAPQKKETEKKPTKKKSEVAIEAELPAKKSSPDAEARESAEQEKVVESKKEEWQGSEQAGPENREWMASNSSSVVVELFSEKPALEEDFYSERNQERESAATPVSEERKNMANENQLESRNCGSQEKPIVKSVWALTKVLLYEDGTKKLEVLEASLTPPGYCLKSSDQKPSENISN